MNPVKALAFVTLAALAGILGVGAWYQMSLPGDVPQAVASSFMFAFLIGGAILVLDTTRLTLRRRRRAG